MTDTRSKYLITISRRDMLVCSAFGAGSLLLPHRLRAAPPPTDDPARLLNLGWTGRLAWDRVVDIATIDTGENWDQRLAHAQSMLEMRGGGVVYFPPGTYRFTDHIRLKNGVVLRGAAPKPEVNAHDERYRPPTRFEFPKFQPVFSGDGTPIATAFKGIYLEDPARAANCGVVNIDINRGHIHFAEDEKHRCGGNRIVFGCVLRNAAVADPRVPSAKLKQHAWQRYTHRHHAAIDVQGHQNVLVANNRLPRSGDDTFTMKGYVLKPARGSKDRYDVVFDYDNRPGMYVCHHCVGGAGGSGNDGTPESHPWGFRKGIVIRDNYVYNTGRMGIGFTGDGVQCVNNVIRFEKDVWRPTNTGHGATHGSSTNDNRAIEMRGWRWVVDGNDYTVHRNWAAQRGYLINDGEGLMHEDHCNSTIRDSRLTNNVGNSYLSIYKCGSIDGLHIEGNRISTPGKIADIFVVSSRNSGPQPCRNASIVKNVTQSNGIRMQGSPAKNNVIADNRHEGRGGTITNKADARVSGNHGYDG